MCVGLAITAVVAYVIASAPALIGALVSNHLVFVALFLVLPGVVFFMGGGGE